MRKLDQAITPWLRTSSLGTNGVETSRALSGCKGVVDIGVLRGDKSSVPDQVYTIASLVPAELRGAGSL
jgi:hypothetical protein